VESTPPVLPVSERHVGLLVIAASVVCAVSGVALMFVYRPNEYSWLRTVHAGSAAMALISAIAARVVGSAGRLRPSTRGLVTIVFGVLVVGGAFATGTVIAWQGGTPSDAGMFLDPDRQVRSGNSTIGGRALLWSFLLHAALAVASLALLAGRAVRLWWVRSRNGATAPDGGV